MSETPVVGKPSPRRLQALLGGSLGAASPDLLVRPGPGLDAAILRLDDGRVMAVAEDPSSPRRGCRWTSWAGSRCILAQAMWPSPESTLNT